MRGGSSPSRRRTCCSRIRFDGATGMRGTLRVRFAQGPLHRDEPRGHELPAVAGRARTPRQALDTTGRRGRVAAPLNEAQAQGRARRVPRTRPVMESGGNAVRAGPVAGPAPAAHRGERPLHGEGARPGSALEQGTRKPGGRMPPGANPAEKPPAGATPGRPSAFPGGRTSRRGVRPRSHAMRQAGVKVEGGSAQTATDRAPVHRMRRMVVPDPVATLQLGPPAPKAGPRAVARVPQTAHQAAMPLPSAALRRPERLPRALPAPRWMSTADRAAPPGRWRPAAISERATRTCRAVARSCTAAPRWSRAPRHARSRRKRRVAVRRPTTSCDRDPERGLLHARPSTTNRTTSIDRTVDPRPGRRRRRHRRNPARTQTPPPQRRPAPDPARIRESTRPRSQLPNRSPVSGAARPRSQLPNRSPVSGAARPRSQLPNRSPVSGAARPPGQLAIPHRGAPPSAASRVERP